MSSSWEDFWFKDCWSYLLKLHFSYLSIFDCCCFKDFTIIFCSYLYLEYNVVRNKYELLSPSAPFLYVHADNQLHPREPGVRMESIRVVFIRMGSVNFAKHIIRENNCIYWNQLRWFDIKQWETIYQFSLSCIQKNTDYLIL